MNKKILALALAAGTVFALPGCASQSLDTLYDDVDLSAAITLAAYKGVEVSAAEAEEQVESAIASILSNLSTTSDITDRAVQDGDTVNIDYVGYMDGTAFDGGTDAGFDLVIGSDTFIDGFEDGIIGHNIDETFDVVCTFPDPYQNNPDLAGKEATFSVKVNRIKTTVTPEFTDAVCAENTEYATVAEYREATLTEAKKNLAWAEVYENTAVNTYPDSYVKEYYSHMLEYYTNMATAYGYTSVEEFMKSYMGTSIDEALAYIAEYAKSQCKQEMILLSIASAEGLTISDEAYDNRAESCAAAAGYASIDEAEEYAGRLALELNMLMEDVINLIYTNAVIVD